MKKYLFFALLAGFTFVTIIAYQEAKPLPKAPIYNKIKEYSPYYMDKRFGGLQIMSKIDKEFKEKPSNMEVFHRLEFLEKEWGKKHIKIIENQVVISDNNKTELIKIPIKTEEDSRFIHSFFGI